MITETRMYLEIVILSEVNHKEKGQYFMISLICGILKKYYKIIKKWKIFFLEMFFLLINIITVLYSISNK